MVAMVVAVVVVGNAGVEPDSDAYGERKHHHPWRRLVFLLAVVVASESLH